jgi:hypothetical protein
LPDLRTCCRGFFEIAFDTSPAATSSRKRMRKPPKASCRGLSFAIVL